MKLCSGDYILHGAVQSIHSHQPIVFDEHASIEGKCPLCAEKAWHEDTALTLRDTEGKVGRLKGIIVELGRDDLID